MAKGIRALLDTVIQALPQVGNLGLLFFLLFFIFAALGVELFGRLGKEIEYVFFYVFAHYEQYIVIEIVQACLKLFRLSDTILCLSI